MNQKICIITLVGMISLAVVSAVSEEGLINYLEESYDKTQSELTDADRDNLDYFKQLVLFQSGDIYSVNDLFFDIPEVALSRAIIGYLRQKSRPYQLEEAEKEKYTEDYHHLLVIPCENLRGLWLYPMSFFLKKKNDDKELIRSIKAEYEIYNWLETAYICHNLVEDKDKMAEKSFKYMISSKPKGGKRGENKPDDHVEAESVAN